MARVISCDICGKIYTEEGTVDEFMRVDILKRNGGGVYNCHEQDYCPKCTKHILDFVDVMRRYPNQWEIRVLDEKE